MMRYLYVLLGLALVGWFYACKTYLHASNPDNHIVLGSIQTTRFVQMSVCTHINYIGDAQRPLHGTGLAPVWTSTHKFLTLVDLFSSDKKLHYFLLDNKSCRWNTKWNYTIFTNSDALIMNHKWHSAVWQGRFCQNQQLLFGFLNYTRKKNLQFQKLLKFCVCNYFCCYLSVSVWRSSFVVTNAVASVNRHHWCMVVQNTTKNILLPQF